MAVETRTTAAVAVDPVHELAILPADEPTPAGRADDSQPEKPDASARRKKFVKNCVFWLVIVAIGLGIWFSGLMVSVVKTGSMRPGIQPGDLVVSMSTKFVKPQLGSIVVAEPVVAGSKLPAIAHRVIEVNPDGTYTTKGDYNPEPDAWRDRPEDVTSVVLFKVPMGWSRSPMTIAAGIGLLALVFMWPSSKKQDEPESDETVENAAEGEESQDEPEVDLREPQDRDSIKV